MSQRMDDHILVMFWMTWTLTSDLPNIKAKRPWSESDLLQDVILYHYCLQTIQNNYPPVERPQ